MLSYGAFGPQGRPRSRPLPFPCPGFVPGVCGQYGGGASSTRVELLATEADGSDTALLAGVVWSTNETVTSKHPMTMRANGKKREDNLDCILTPRGVTNGYTEN